jgi:Cu(I)/Ag(I) efflux system membrane fusion protein
VVVDLFDRDADIVRAGQNAEVRVRALPGRIFRGVVKRVESDVDVGLRSVKVIIHIQDRDAVLRPNLSVDVTVHAAAGGARLLVPREALIRTGRRTAVVRALGDGRFEPVPVTAGNEYGDQVEIIEGIREGDDIVTSGQFLIDSEASVRASFERMQGDDKQAPNEPKKAQPDTGHDGHEVTP